MLYIILAVSSIAGYTVFLFAQPIGTDYLNQFVSGLVAGVFVIYLTLAANIYRVLKKPTGLQVKVLEMRDAIQTREALEAYVLPPMDQAQYATASLNDKFNYLSLYYTIAECKTVTVTGGENLRITRTISCTIPNLQKNMRRKGSTY